MLHRFKICGLYGLYNYDLCFDNSEHHIIFITGPNGYGKTTILKIIDAIYSLQFKDLLNIRFDSLEMQIDKCLITMSQDVKRENVEEGIDYVNKPIVEIKLNISMPGGLKYSDILKSDKDNNFDTLFKVILSAYIKSRKKYFISDQRRISHAWRCESENIEGDVNKNAKTLRKMLEKNHINPPVFSLQEEDLIDEVSYVNERQNVIQTIKEWSRYGVIDFDEKLVRPYTTSEAPFLRYYINRWKDELKKYDLLLHKLKLFEEIIRDADFANKNMSIHEKYGYQFVMNDKDRTIIGNNCLSSGEQHILIQFFYLLFNAENEEMLFLIDEPELSMHMYWQTRYLNNLRKISELRPLQCIVATHSPAIFNNHWELTVDLFEKSNLSCDTN